MVKSYRRLCSYYLFLYHIIRGKEKVGPDRWAILRNRATFPSNTPDQTLQRSPCPSPLFCRKMPNIPPNFVLCEEAAMRKAHAKGCIDVLYQPFKTKNDLFTLSIWKIRVLARSPLKCRGDPRGRPVRGRPVRGRPVRGRPVRGRPEKSQTLYIYFALISKLTLMRYT